LFYSDSSFATSVTFPSPVKTGTTFYTNQDDIYLVSCLDNGVECADTPDGKKSVALINNATSVISPSIDVVNQSLAAELYLSKYSGYDSTDGTVAMSAFMQAYFDAAALRKVLLVPQKPDALGAKWTLTGAVTTANTNLPPTTPAGTTITVASATGLPTSGPFPIIMNATGSAANNEYRIVTAINGTTLTLEARTGAYITTGSATGTAGQATIVVANEADLAKFAPGYVVTGTGLSTLGTAIVTGINAGTRTVTLAVNNVGTVNNVVTVTPPGYAAGKTQLGTGSTAATLSNIVIGSPVAAQITWTTAAAHGFVAGQTVTVTSGVTGGTNILNKTFTIVTVPSPTTFYTSTTATDASVASGTVTAATGTVTASSSSTYTIMRALPFLDNLKVRGQFTAGSEGQPVAIKVTSAGGSLSAQCPFYWGGGSDNTVDGAEIEDIAHWGQENRASVGRPLFHAASISTLKDVRFNRCHFKWFTSLKFVCSRVQLTNLYINNLYSIYPVGSGTDVGVSGEGLVQLTGSDSVLEKVYIDTDTYVPSDRSLVQCRWSQSRIDYVYITPAPGRAFEVTGYISGLQVGNLVINGLNNHTVLSGLDASKPAAAMCKGLLYRTTDLSPNVIYRSDGTSWSSTPANGGTTNADTYLSTNTTVAGLASASTNSGRWALVTDTNIDSTNRAFYSDGVRWRGPFKTSPNGSSAWNQYWGGDYGVLVKDVYGCVQFSNLFIRQVAENETTGFTGAIRADNAAVQIGNLILEQVYGTDLVTLNGGKISIGNIVKDGVTSPVATANVFATSGTAGTITRASSTNL
jgi:hypothetical protein